MCTGSDLARWVVHTLDELGDRPGDEPAAVRLRLLPSPLDSDTVARLDWRRGPGLADELAEQVERQLDGRRLADRLQSRLELLDGAGTPIRGRCRARTWGASAPPLPPTDEAPLPPHPTPTATVLDAQGAELEFPQELRTLDRMVGGGLVTPGEAPSTDRMALAGMGLAIVSTQRTLASALDMNRQLLGEVLAMGGVLRQCATARDGLLEEVLPAMISATGAAADARAAATVAEVTADAKVALNEAQAGGPPDRVGQGIRLLEQLGKTLSGAPVKVRVQPHGAAPAPAPVAEGAAPAPAPVAEEAGPDEVEVPRWVTHLPRILRGEVPAELAARVIGGNLEEGQKAHLQALARAILADSGAGSES